MNWWAKYRGRSTGRVIHFLHAYCGLNIAEMAVIGYGTISLYGKPFATFVWSNKSFQQDVPEFKFIGENSEYYTSRQYMCQKKAIFSAIYLNGDPDPEEIIPVHVDILNALIKDGYRAAKLYSSTVEKEPRFFVWKNSYLNDKVPTLYFEAGKERFYWDGDLKCWLYANDPNNYALD